MCVCVSVCVSVCVCVCAGCKIFRVLMDPKQMCDVSRFVSFRKLITILFFCPMPPHVVCGLRGPPSWAWQECNRLLRLGRP